MKAIDRKLLRDLWQMRSQVVTVALVVASAFSGFAGSLATYYSLEQAREEFYESARFGHVFADIKRAPREIERRIAVIPGVSDAETTVVFDVTLDVAGLAEPIVGRMIGLPESGMRRLDQLVIRRGRAPERDAPGEVVISEGFANARGLGPGKSVTALINGRKRDLAYRRRWPVSGLHLRNARRRLSRRSQLRCVLDRPRPARCRVQHGGGVQPRHGAADTGRDGTRRHRCS